MATLYVTEYARMVVDGAGASAAVGQEPSTTQTVAIGASSAASTAFQTTTRFVRLHCDAVCGVAFGTSPSAVAGASMRLAANQTEFFGVVPGLSVAVVSAT